VGWRGDGEIRERNEQEEQGMDEGGEGQNGEDTGEDRTPPLFRPKFRDVVLETKVLVSRLLKDKILKSWSCPLKSWS
jgi:hypothetical protein